MFAKAEAKRPPVEPQRDDRRRVPSIVSTDMKIVGDIFTDGDVQIDGTVEGDVQVRILTVGETGRIVGAVTGATVRVHGSVDGSIKAREVVLAATAKVSGDIEHEALEMTRGAHFEGASRRLRGETSKTFLIQGPAETVDRRLPAA